MFIKIVLGLVVVSIISSLISLWSVQRKSKLEKKAKEELFQSKVLFQKGEGISHSDSSSGSSSKSDL